MQCESLLWSKATELTPLLNIVYSIIHQSIDVKIEEPSGARLPVPASQRPAAGNQEARGRAGGLYVPASPTTNQSHSRFPDLM